jgi:hypothetical protein
MRHSLDCRRASKGEIRIACQGRFLYKNSKELVVVLL